MGDAFVVSRETREVKTECADDDAALLYAVRESLRLQGLGIQVVLSDGGLHYVWTQTL